jgi:hypothetical protein
LSSRAASAGSVPSPRHCRVAEAGEIARDVAARRWIGRGTEIPVLIVLDVEEHRQLLRRGDGQRRPEAVRATSVAAEHDRDGLRVRFAFQNGAIIFDRLRPARGRRVLRADAARHRQRRHAARIWEVEHDADVAPVRIAAGAAHRGAQRILDRHAEREQKRARAIIAAGRVARVGEARAEHDLRHVVPARTELVGDLALGDEPRLFQLVERAADLGQIGDPAPVIVRIGRVADGALELGRVSHSSPP